MPQRLSRRSHLLLIAAGLSAAERRRLDRDNLLEYRDARGRIQPVRRVADWQKRRAEILDGMQQIMGPFPGGRWRRSPPRMLLDEETDCGAYLRQLIRYEVEPQAFVPAFLLVPKQASKQRRRPAVLCLHPTHHKLGHKVVVGLGPDPQRAYAHEVAERGWVALAPAYPLLADYQPDLKRLGYVSGTMKAIWDNVRGLDLLQSLPFVRRGGFAAIGHSLGGHNAVYTAVFDERIRMVVSSCGLDSFLDYKNGDIRGWTSARYMPKLLDYKDRLNEIPFDFHELIGALAPRLCFISAPLQDDNFKWESVARIVVAARAVYRLYGRPDRLIVAHPDCGHDFPDQIRHTAYQLLADHLPI